MAQVFPSTSDPAAHNSAYTGGNPNAFIDAYAANPAAGSTQNAAFNTTTVSAGSLQPFTVITGAPSLADVIPFDPLARQPQQTRQYGYQSWQALQRAPAPPLPPMTQ